MPSKIKIQHISINKTFWVKKNVQIENIKRPIGDRKKTLN